MAEGTSSNSFVLKVMIILYAAGIIYVAYKPIRKEAHGAVQELRSWMETNFKRHPPSMRRQATLNARQGESDISKSAKQEPSRKEEEREVEEKTLPRAPVHKKHLDRMTPKDRQELNELIDGL